MIDFVKIGIDHLTAKELQSNKLLDFRLHVSEKTGEVEKRIAKFNNVLEFILFENNGGLIMGSLHKFWHPNTNYDDFYFNELIEAIDTLKNLFGIDPQHARLQNVEIGVNLTDLPISPNQFIQSLILHKGEPFYSKKFRRQSLFKDCYHQRYGIKIYNKGKQYGLPYPVLRYELKYIKMKELNELGIYTLSDLTKPNILPALGALLQAKFRDILLIDPQLPKSDLKAVERRNLADYSNSPYWESMSFYSPKKYQYHRKRYDEMIGRYVTHPVKEQVADAIRRKWQELTFTNSKTLGKLTTHQNPLSGNINHSYSRLKSSMLTNADISFKKVCSYTGLDISNQKAGSKFISEKNSDYQIAHWVRNSDSNPRNNLRRKILRGSNSPTLFDVNQYLKLSDKDKELLKFWEGTRYEIRTN